MAPAPQYSSPSDMFHVYNDNAPNFNLSPMPRGGCNFVDLTPGTAGSRCGCRRFWRLHSADNVTPAQAGWCMCNHHACYHDERSTDETPALASSSALAPALVSGQENLRPKTGREPLSSVFDLSLQVPPAMNSLEMATLAGAPPISFLNHLADDTEMKNAPSVPPVPTPSLPDTLNWAEFLHSDQPQCVLPPIPPQCLLSQKTASTTSSSAQTRYLRPFAGKGLHTLASGHELVAQSPLRHTTRPRSQAGQANQSSGTPMTDLSAQLADARDLKKAIASKESFKNLTQALTGHDQRLERLETSSFAAAATAAHDDCVDKHEHLDLRVTDLEGKVDELEKFANDNDNMLARRGERPDDDGATVSLVSASTTSSAICPANAPGLADHLQSLQSQVTQLQSFLPPVSLPWEVEVVFFPFPLKKLWQDINHFRLDPTSSRDDWTQLPQTNSASSILLRPQSPLFGDWTTPDHDAEWLLPRACGNKSVADKRLRSRGLVKTISVSRPDARSAHAAVESAFGSVFHEMQILLRRQDTDARCSRYIGLQSPWIPLRKVHRDSRLRFLSPAEMVTPALWDVQFLSSVMMRSSEPRLFITHPDAYLQDYFAYEAGWTWQKVRELTRVYPDVEESQQVPEADALEEHWSWSETMDELPHFHTSMNRRQLRRRSTVSPSCTRFPHGHLWRSQSSPFVREYTPAGGPSRSGSLPPHGRPAGVPAPSLVRHPSMDEQRRASTNSGHRRSSPALRVSVQGGIIKGRRTRSPSYPLNTPRWTHSPSPMPLGGGPQDRQPLRGTTPFAYATPHSNAPAPPSRDRHHRARSGSVRFEAHHQYHGYRSSSRPLTAMVVDDEEGDAGDYDDEEEEDDDDDDVEDEDDEFEDYDDDDDDDDTNNVEMVTDAQPRPPLAGDAGGPSLLEQDGGWPGFQDQPPGHGENMDANVSGGSSDPTGVGRRREREQSEQSSRPSEYPSTLMVIKCDSDEEDDFLIHED